MFVNLEVKGKKDPRGGYEAEIILEETIVIWRADRVFETEFEARNFALDRLAKQLKFILK